MNDSKQKDFGDDLLKDIDIDIDSDDDSSIDTNLDSDSDEYESPIPEKDIEEKEQYLDVMRNIVNRWESFLDTINEKELNDKIIYRMNDRKEDLEKQLHLNNTNPLENYIYPSLTDPNFNKKIAQHAEFRQHIFETDIKDVKKHSEESCDRKVFELRPHQYFVKKFISRDTPYRSLLLFHGLGTGKTCSGISVAEEHREYIKQMGISKKIILVASPIIQENFKLQLFDPRKLKKVNGKWNINMCTNDTFLRELNPLEFDGLNKEDIIKQVRIIIKKYYSFMGYIEFSNYISKLKSKSINNKKIIKNEFKDRLIVIDEVQNIRNTKESTTRDLANNLLDVVKYSENLKLLLLSATPMYNDFREIIWLLNLMLINDGRSPLVIGEIFNKDGNFRDGMEELFTRKLTGYVSYLRGEDPYSFPYIIYPKQFDIDKSLLNTRYPNTQLNGSVIDEDKVIQYTDLYFHDLGTNEMTYQNKLLSYYTHSLKNENGFIDEENINDGEKGMGWLLVRPLLQLSNICFPNKSFNDIIENVDYSNIQKIENEPSINNYISKSGIKEVMNIENNHYFSYKQETLDNFGRIFSPDEVSKYSMKMKSICENIKNSEGIILIYSDYIYNGCIPMALCLEEMGIQRYEGKNLFKNLGVTPLLNSNGKKMKYVFITGNTSLSPNNKKELIATTNESNIDGDDVKVVIVSRTGAEGLDFQGIRQIHILEPWYNLSRLEQVMGRGNRFCSHKKLPFEKRNIQIFLHTLHNSNTNVETIDQYIYRMAEKKAIEIGKITRIMKENAIDCNFNKGLNINLSRENMDQNVEQVLSNGNTINIDVGDHEFSHLCDYMENCSYKCKPNFSLEDDNVLNTTVNIKHFSIKKDIIMRRIKDLFNENFVYTEKKIIDLLSYKYQYDAISIINTLEYMINTNEIIIDIFGRKGHVINIKDMYFFHPIEMENENEITMYERIKPNDFKPNDISIRLNKEITKDTLSQPDIMKKNISLLKPINEKVNDTKEYDSDSDEEADALVNKTNPQSLYSIEDKEYIYNKLNSLEQIIQEIINDKKNIILNKENKIYKLLYSTIQHILRNNIISIDNNVLTRVIIHYFYDNIDLDDKLKIIYFLFSNDTFLNDETLSVNIKEFLLLLRNIITEKYKIMDMGNNIVFNTVKDDGSINIIMLNNDKNIFEYPNKLQIAQIGRFMEKNRLIMNVSKYNDVVGFIIYMRNDFVLKIKNLKQKRTKGARCDQAPMLQTIKFINSVIQEDTEYIFNEANIENLAKKQLCRIQEFIFRYYDELNNGSIRYFLHKDESKFQNIENATKFSRK